VYVAAVRHFWLNRTDKFGHCSVVELLITSESCAFKLMSDCIVIKIYYIKQLNYNTDIIHKGWDLYLFIYIQQSVHVGMLAASLARNADEWRKRWDLTVDVDSLSLPTRCCRVPLVLELPLWLTVGWSWLVNYAVRPERSLHLLSNVYFCGVVDSDNRLDLSNERVRRQSLLSTI